MNGERRINGTPKWAGKARQDVACSMCPCPQLTAYWTNPPSWPRRILCESKLSHFCCMCFRDTKQAGIVLGGFLIIYLCIMDIVLYCHFRKANLVTDSKGGRPDEIYTPFTHLSIKALLNDQMSQYLVTPSAEYFETFIRLSTILPFITPNVVTVTHFITGFLAGKWMSSDNLYDRRIGVVMFEFRTWLDQYDGSVYRARPENHLRYSMNVRTWGYLIDCSADTFGGCFLCLSVFFYFLKRFGPPRVQCYLPFYRTESPQEEEKRTSLMMSESGKETYGALYLFWKAFTYGTCLTCGGIFWSNVVDQATYIFETPIADPVLSALQNEYCHSYITIFLFQMWRLIGSQCMLTYLLLLIFFDKTWEFLQGYQFVLFGMVVALYLASVLWLWRVRQAIFK